MDLTRDETFAQKGEFDLFTCRCRLRIWEGDGNPPVVVFTQLADYLGPSVTNRIEWLAWEACIRLGLPQDGVTVVQHYPDRGPCRNGRPALPGTVDIVTFTRTEQGFSDPCWQTASRAEIEAMTGQPLQG